MKTTHILELAFERDAHSLKKLPKNQDIKRRKPKQERAREKIELIFEAAIRLIQEGGLDGLTTNAIAEKAGVSIGTLYQYFGNKHAVVNALADREMGQLSEKVLAVMKGPAPAQPGGRIPLVIQAIIGSYGGRRGVHQQLLLQALARGGGSRLEPLFAKVVDAFASGGVTIPVGGQARISRADAFVMTHAFAGVMRAVSAGANSPPLREIEASITKLITNFVFNGA